MSNPLKTTAANDFDVLAGGRLAKVAGEHLAKATDSLDEVEMRVEFLSIRLMPGDVLKARKAMAQMREAAEHIRQVLRTV